MKKFYLLTKTLLAVALLCVGQNAWGQAAGTYYIQNVGTGKWLSPANSWETQASVLNHADYWKLANGTDGKYTLESVVSNGSNAKIYLNGGYCDGTTQNLTFTAIGGNTYSIMEGTKYYTTDGTTVSATADDASSNNAQWKLYSLDDLKTAMASATPASGVDATFFIKDHNLSRNNRDYSAWSNTGATEPKTSQGGAASNRYSIEAFQKTFDVHQSLTSIPNGVYGLQVNGFYRQDGTDKLPYLYAGDNKVTLPARTGTENDMQAAAESFVAGSYLSDRAIALVTDGNLTVGVGTEGTSCWTIFKNFHLTYYGNPTVANPLDMTSWIVNPDIEVDGAGTGDTYKRSITGWSHNNTDGNYRPLAIPAANNTSGAFTGSYCAEIWKGSGLSGKKIYQVVSGLPNGVYKLQLAAMIDGTATNEFIYGKSNGQTFTKTLDGTASQSKDYELYAIVSDGTLEIGLDMNTSAITWAMIDNARLSYYGTSDEAYELVTEDLASSHVIPVPSTYPLNSTTTATNPFDAGSFVQGTNVTALNVNSTTASAWIGSNVKPVTLSENEAISISFTAYHGWLSNGANQGVKLLNSGGHTIAEYVYHLKDQNITAVNIGGSTAEGFSTITQFRSMKDASNNADGFSASKPYQSDVKYNTVFTLNIRYDGYITVTISRGQGNKLYTYTGKLPDNWDIDLQKIQVYSGSNNSDRTISISDLKIERTFAYDITAVDGSGNELATIFRGAAASDGSTTAYWNKYIKVADQWYETTGSYGKNITTAENKVTYSASNIEYFVEGEKMTGYSAAAQYIGTAYSGGIRGRHAENSNWKMGISISEAGPYTISFPHKYDSSSSASTLNLYEVKSDASEVQIEEKSISADGTYTKDYTFSAGSDLKISKGSGNSNWLIDYVTLSKKAVAYTVKYMCGETEIKTADASRTAQWGTKVALTAGDKSNIIFNHESYAYSSDDAATVEIASDESSVITVNFTKVPFYELADVTTSATWDWSVISTSDKAYGELTGETTPTNSEPFILKNLELYGKQDGSNYSIPAGFGNAQQLEVNAQYPFRYQSGGGKLQGSSIKFHTTVPGTVQVKFSNTGGGERPARHVVVNGTQSASGSADTTPITSEAIPVAAGDVTITGYIPSTSESNMLQIYQVVFTPTLNTAGYNTFSSSSNIQVSGANAYTAVLDVNEGIITCTPIADNKIPAGNGVLLYSTSGEAVTFTVIDNAPALGDNDLKATTAANGDLAEKAATGHTYYVLNGDTFKRYTGAAFVAGKAFFDVESNSNDARAMRVVFNDKITGVANVTATSDATLKDGKYLEKGNIVIVKNGVKYNAAGAKLY